MRIENPVNGYRSTHGHVVQIENINSSAGTITVTVNGRISIAIRCCRVDIAGFAGGIFFIQDLKTYERL
jgi:hypothetical protein